MGGQNKEMFAFSALLPTFTGSEFICIFFVEMHPDLWVL